MLLSCVRHLVMICIQGSLFFLMYLLVMPLTSRILNSKWHYYILKLNCLFFLVPVGMIMGNAGVSKSIDKTGMISNSIPQMVDKIFIPTTSKAVSVNHSTINWLSIIAAIWLIGALVYLAYHLTCVALFLKDIQKSSEVKNPAILQSFKEIKAEVGISKTVDVCYNDVFLSPVIVWLFKTKVVLPNRSYSEQNLRYIFIHELTHMKKHDLFFKYLLLAIETIFWFNPLLIFFRKEFEKRLEYSCDEAVAKELNFEQRKDYGRSIIESSVKSNSFHHYQYGLKFASNREQLERRLKNMLNLKKMSNGKKALAAALTVGILTGGTLTAYAMSSSPNELSSVGIETADINNKIMCEYLFLRGGDSFGKEILNGKFFRKRRIVYEKSKLEKICSSNGQLRFVLKHNTSGQGGRKYK